MVGSYCRSMTISMVADTGPSSGGKSNASPVLVAERRAPFNVMVNTCTGRDRSTGVEVRVLPSPVQGDARSVLAGCSRMNGLRWLRGGRAREGRGNSLLKRGEGPHGAAFSWNLQPPSRILPQTCSRISRSRRCGLFGAWPYGPASRIAGCGWRGMRQRLIFATGRPANAVRDGWAGEAKGSEFLEAA